MAEKRKEKRTDAKDVVTILDGENGEALGTLVNISPCGIGIRGEVKLHTDEERELLLLLDKPIFGEKRIHIDAQCAWSRNDSDTSYYLSGFEFTDVSPEDANLILGFIMAQQSA